MVGCRIRQPHAMLLFWKALIRSSLSLSPCAVSLISVFVCFFCVPVAVFSFLFFFLLLAAICRPHSRPISPPHTHIYRHSGALIYIYTSVQKISGRAGGWRRRWQVHTLIYIYIYTYTIPTNCTVSVFYVIQFQPPPPFGLRQREAVVTQGGVGACCCGLRTGSWELL